jgi:mannose-6-phosphate isomerase-like protein (cupin superfamily)
MRAFRLPDLVAHRATEEPWLEFLRVPALRAGVYVLPAGGEDPQSPHAEDEVYYVLRGRARFRAGDEESEVGPGALLYVAAGEVHRFHSIAEELVLLVFFARGAGAV